MTHAVPVRALLCHSAALALLVLGVPALSSAATKETERNGRKRTMGPSSVVNVTRTGGSDGAVGVSRDAAWVRPACRSRDANGEDLT